MSRGALAYEADLAALTASLPSHPVFLSGLRARALEAFQAQGLPTVRREEWKYTPLREVAQTAWQPSEPGPALFEFELPFRVEGSVRVVMVNGRFDRNLSDTPAIKGLTVSSLHTAAQEQPDDLAKLGELVALDSFPFGALNTALWQDGLFIKIEAGAMVDPVIEIVHVSTHDGQAHAPRLFIDAGEGSSARIVENWITTPGARTLTIPVTESFIGERANIEHIRVQDEAETAFNIALWESRQAGSSEYKAYTIAFGAALGRLDQNIDIAGEHAVTRLDGVAAAMGSQLIDNHTQLDHAVPNCNSFEIYKQVIGGQATVVFNGKIMVHQDAQKTDAKQTNQALLLSPDATINSKPQLEIFADDVKCTHGATVGQLEDSPRFYMMSRGIPRSEADRLLVYAFAAEVLELISIDEVRLALEARLMDKLG
jgi:Fe-S cluster assembly protein SufD